MKDLFIMRGIPGAGKTTTALTLSENAWAVYSADDYFMVNGEYKWDVSKIGAAHKSCQDRVRRAMRKGIDKLFVANTNTTAKEMAPYFKMAEEFGYRVHSLIVENRHDGVNEHNVPAETLEKMTERFQVKL